MNKTKKLARKEIKRSGFGLFKNLGKFLKKDKFKGQLE